MNGLSGRCSFRLLHNDDQEMHSSSDLGGQPRFCLQGWQQELLAISFELRLPAAGGLPCNAHSSYERGCLSCISNG